MDKDLSDFYKKFRKEYFTKYNNIKEIYNSSSEYYVNSIPTFKGSTPKWTYENVNTILKYLFGIEFNKNTFGKLTEEKQMHIVFEILKYILPHGKYFIEQNKYKNKLTPEEQQVLGCYSEVSTGILNTSSNQIGVEGLLNFKGIEELLDANRYSSTNRLKNMQTVTEIFEYVYKNNLKTIQLYYQNLFMIMSQVPKNEEEFFVFRGLTTDKLLDIETFISTTYDITVANKFSLRCNNPTLLVIKIPRGSHVTALGQLSMYKTENEIVIPPNYKLEEYGRKDVISLNARNQTVMQTIIYCSIRERKDYNFKIDLKKMYPTFEDFLNKYKIFKMIKRFYEFHHQNNEMPESELNKYKTDRMLHSEYNKWLYNNFKQIRYNFKKK